MVTHIKPCVNAVLGVSSLSGLIFLNAFAIFRLTPIDALVVYENFDFGFRRNFATLFESVRGAPLRLCVNLVFCSQCKPFSDWKLEWESFSKTSDTMLTCLGKTNWTFRLHVCPFCLISNFHHGNSFENLPKFRYRRRRECIFSWSLWNRSKDFQVLLFV